MPAFLERVTEPVVHILRAGLDARFFDNDYTAAGTVTAHALTGPATVRGFCGERGAFTRLLHQEIVEAIRAIGYSEVLWQRRKNGVWVEHRA